MNSCALAFLLPALYSTTEQYCQAFLVPKCWWHTMVAPFSNQHFYSSAIQQRNRLNMVPVPHSQYVVMFFPSHDTNLSVTSRLSS